MFEFVAMHQFHSAEAALVERPGWQLAGTIGAWRQSASAAGVARVVRPVWPVFVAEKQVLEVRQGSAPVVCQVTSTSRAYFRRKVQLPVLAGELAWLQACP